jgi:uncharacterized protein
MATTIFRFPTRERRTSVRSSRNSQTYRLQPVVVEYLHALHLNPAKWWRIFSDVFAVSLILIVITGLLIPRGRQGLAGRGKWLVGTGILVPLVALVMM